MGKMGGLIWTGGTKERVENYIGRGPAVTFWDVLWKRDGVKLKNWRVNPKAPQALLHNCASLTKAHCKNNRKGN